MSHKPTLRNPLLIPMIAILVVAVLAVACLLCLNAGVFGPKAAPPRVTQPAGEVPVVTADPAADERLDELQAQLDEANSLLDEANAALDAESKARDELQAKLDEANEKLDEANARLEEAAQAPVPTVVPTAEPTAEPTAVPTAEPTAEPVITAAPEATEGPSDTKLEEENSALGALVASLTGKLDDANAKLAAETDAKNALKTELDDTKAKLDEAERAAAARQTALDNAYAALAKRFGKTATAQGHDGPVTVTAIVNSEGVIVWLDADVSGESRAEGVAQPAFLTQFPGKSLPLTLGADVDVVSGATVSSQAVVDALNTLVP